MVPPVTGNFAAELVSCKDPGYYHAPSPTSNQELIWCYDSVIIQTRPAVPKSTMAVSGCRPPGVNQASGQCLVLRCNCWRIGELPQFTLAYDDMLVVRFGSLRELLRRF